MHNTVDAASSRLTQLTAINLAKTLTIVLLVGYAIVFGVRDFRQVLYLCLQISYCLWWLLEQWLFPQRRQTIFQEAIDWKGLIFILLFVGAFFTLPGYLSFINPAPLSFVTAAVALVLYIFGSLINASADVQKLIAKQSGTGLVKDEIWRLSRNINYLGDLLRYLSFSVLAGSLWAYLLPLSVGLVYWQRMAQQETSMAEKYADFAEYQAASAYLIPFIW